MRELAVLLTEVEAVVNYRPLTCAFNDADELYPLSLADFLVGGRLTALPLYDNTVSTGSTNVELENLWRK